MIKKSNNLKNCNRHFNKLIREKDSINNRNSRISEFVIGDCTDELDCGRFKNKITQDQISIMTQSPYNANNLQKKLMEEKVIGDIMMRRGDMARLGPQDYVDYQADIGTSELKAYHGFHDFEKERNQLIYDSLSKRMWDKTRLYDPADIREVNKHHYTPFGWRASKNEIDLDSTKVAKNLYEDKMHFENIPSCMLGYSYCKTKPQNTELSCNNFTNEQHKEDFNYTLKKEKVKPKDTIILYDETLCNKPVKFNSVTHKKIKQLFPELSDNTILSDTIKIKQIQGIKFEGTDLQLKLIENILIPQKKIYNPYTKKFDKGIFQTKLKDITIEISPYMYKTLEKNKLIPHTLYDIKDTTETLNPFFARYKNRQKRKYRFQFKDDTEYSKIKYPLLEKNKTKYNKQFELKDNTNTSIIEQFKNKFSFKKHNPDIVDGKGDITIKNEIKTKKSEGSRPKQFIYDKSEEMEQSLFYTNPKLNKIRTKLTKFRKK